MAHLKVKIIGIAPDKTKAVLRHLPTLLSSLMGNRASLRCSNIATMSPDEVGGDSQDGYWDRESNTVKVDPTLDQDQMLKTSLRELLRAHAPTVSEKSLRTIVDNAVSKLQLVEGNKTLHKKVFKKKQKDPYFPGLIGSDSSPWTPTRSRMPGPGSFGPVQIGRARPF